MLERSRLWARTGVLCVAAAALAVVLIVASAVASGSRPTIVGDPVVGKVLSVTFTSEDRDASTSTGEFDGLYRWQSCDPAVADCFASTSHSDPNWTGLPAPDDNPHNNPTYTIVSADVGHFIRVLTHENSLGAKWRVSDPVGPVTGPVKVAPPPPLEPEHGISFLAQPTAGTVKIKGPGASDYAPLTGEEKIPMGSVVDTRGGTVKVTAAVGNLGDTTADNSLRLWDGLIRIEQPGDRNAAATARLVEKLRCGKAKGRKAAAGKSSGAVATKSGKRRRRVWGSGRGNYKTQGSGGTGSVRGTTWLTKDTCRGTFFKVTDGIGISVFDFDLGQTFDLGPGQSYFARNR
ncbi:MAG TPA: hypothetical protein VLB79_12820 [Solirubrobacterales bacterium]|nr:hypothetical protein [Solirubrobacterales bacterium]